MQISFYLISRLAVILFFSLILSIQDLKHLKVGIYIQWAAVFCALLCHLIFAREGMWIYIISSLLMGAFYFAVRKLTRNRLGPADVLFGFFQGLFLTPFFIPFCMGVEAIAALIVVKKNGREKFPFIPFMSFGLIMSWIIQTFIC